MLEIFEFSKRKNSNAHGGPFNVEAMRQFRDAALNRSRLTLRQPSHAFSLLQMQLPFDTADQMAAKESGAQEPTAWIDWLARKTVRCVAF